MFLFMQRPAIVLRHFDGSEVFFSFSNMKSIFRHEKVLATVVLSLKMFVMMTPGWTELAEIFTPSSCSWTKLLLVISQLMHHVTTSITQCQRVENLRYLEDSGQFIRMKNVGKLGLTVSSVVAETIWFKMQQTLPVLILQHDIPILRENSDWSQNGLSGRITNFFKTYPFRMRKHMPWRRDIDDPSLDASVPACALHVLQ